MLFPLTCTAVPNSTENISALSQQIFMHFKLFPFLSALSAASLYHIIFSLTCLGGERIVPDTSHSAWHDSVASCGKPLITDEDMAVILTQFKICFPLTSACLFGIVLSDKNEQPAQADKAYNDAKRGKALEAFLALGRVKDCQNLVYWALCDALGHAALGMSKVAMQPHVWRRYTIHLTHAVKLVKDLSKNAADDMRSLLREQLVVSGAFDNHQQVRTTKHQRGGYGSRCIKGTVRLARRNFKPIPPVGSVVVKRGSESVFFLVRGYTRTGVFSSDVVIETQSFMGPQHFTIRWPNKDWTYVSIFGAEAMPQLTYVPQHIPRTFNMRFFASIPFRRNVFAFHDDAQRDANGHMMPLPVAWHMSLIRRSRNCGGFFRYLTRPPNRKATPAANSRPRHVPPTHPDNPSLTDEQQAMIQLVDDDRDMLAIAKQYQRDYASVINPHIREVAQLMLLRMSRFDEVTKEGALQVFIQLLYDFGLLDKHGNTANYKAVADIANRLVMLSGDCLSNDNMRAMDTKVRAQSTHLGLEDYVKQIILAMNQVRECPGDLHIGMHMVCVIFKYFYGGCIQAVQAILHWKRIQLNPLKRYQASSSIIRIMTEELTRVRMLEWAKTKKFQVPPGIVRNCRQYQNGVSLNDLKNHFTKQERILIVEHSYEVWSDTLRNSKDECVFYMAAFNEIANSYLLYLDSIRCGDSPAQEFVLAEWAPLWKVSEKRRYVELVFTTMECFYESMTIEHLEEFRLNRSVRLTAGRDMIATDDACEVLNDWVKEMNTKDNIIDLCEQSIMLSLMRRCARSSGAFMMYRDKISSSIKPRSQDERNAIFKLFTEAKVCTEATPARKLTNNFLWDHFDSCVMVKKKKNNDGKRNAHEAKVHDVFCCLKNKDPKPITMEELQELSDTMTPPEFGLDEPSDEDADENNKDDTGSGEVDDAGPNNANEHGHRRTGTRRRRKCR